MGGYILKFKIPDSFFIGSMKITVKTVNICSDNAEDSMGLANIFDSAIELKKGMSEQQKEFTFFHELVHFLIYYSFIKNIIA
jgi:Zn-dependent peptidase ImmA (M78 family)